MIQTIKRILQHYNTRSRTGYFMMRAILTFLLLLVSSLSFSQDEFSEEDLAALQKYEENLRVLGDSVVSSYNWDMREQACVQMVKSLVKALKVPNSFNYPFDSVRTISIIYPDDRSFRIITWQMQMKDETHRYYGAIQLNSAELKLFPLIDMSMFIPDVDKTTLNQDNWYGQIYYDIQDFKYKKEKYYLIFGWDGHDRWSNKKIADVLWFDEGGKPKFGQPIFEVEEGDVRQRVIIEYKEDASPAMVWDDQMKMIVFDYLRPENPMSEGIYMTYIPDGTYQGFYFDKKKRHWVMQRVVFDDTLDEAPLNRPKHEGTDPNIYED